MNKEPGECFRTIIRGAVLSSFVAVFCAVPGSSYTIDGFLDALPSRLPRLSTSYVPEIPADTSGLSVSCASADAFADPVNSGNAQAVFADAVNLPLDDPCAASEELPLATEKPLRPADAALLLSLLAGLVLMPLARKRYRTLKRIFDVAGATLALALAFPIMVFITVMIRIDSPGPVFLRQVRVGFNRRRGSGRFSGANKRQARNLGQLFVMYKFRTMRADAEADGPVWAREHDERVTRVGRILRKTHLDELPQFFNVLRGEMCIVGPRPERPVFINRLGEAIPSFENRLRVKPGITGLAQVRYRYAASVGDAKKKLKYDLLYIRKMCLSMDIQILLNTFNSVISTKGAR